MGRDGRCGDEHAEYTRDGHGDGQPLQAGDPVADALGQQDARGVRQSVCGRNDHDLAWARLEALGVADNFALTEIGWRRKSGAVRRITEQLDFAPAAVASIADQPAERAESTRHFPQVRRYPVEDAATPLELPRYEVLVTTPTYRVPGR